jgi:hypothetical protein
VGISTVNKQGEELFEGKPVAQLPLFDGFRQYRLEVMLGGSVTMSLSDDANRSLLEAMKLNRSGVIHVTIGEQTFQLDARVQQKTHKLKSNPDTKTVEPVTIVRIAVESDEL